MSYQGNIMFSDEDYDGLEFIQDVNCNLNDKTRICDSWILLNGQSTVYVFMNNKLLKNIGDAKKQLCPHCNAQITTVNKIGDFKGYKMVWYYEDGIAKIFHCTMWRRNISNLW